QSSTNRLLSMPITRESEKIPEPPRRLVLPSPKMSQAKPTRGAKPFRLALSAFLGMPGSLGTPFALEKKIPGGALGYTREVTFVAIFPRFTCAQRLPVSLHGSAGSQRRPRFKVSRRVTRKLSWAYTPEKVLRLCLNSPAPCWKA